MFPFSKPKPVAKSYDYTLFEPQFQNRDYSGLFSIKDQSVYWTNPEDYKSVVKRLFFDCAVSRACINIRANKVASVPIVVESGNADSQLLLQSPNTTDNTLRQSLRVWEEQLLLGGDLWLFLDKSISKRPQLWMMRQDFMIQDPKAGYVTYDPGRGTGKSQPAYRFQMDGSVCVGVEQNQGGRWISVPGSLFHLMDHNPLSSGQGSGSGDAVLKAVDAWISANALINSRFQAGGRKQGYIRAASVSTDEEMGAFREMMRQLNDQKELAVLADGADWVSNQLSFTDLDIVNVMNNLTRTIANGFDVPAVMLNLEGESSYANQRGADRIFYQGVIKPRAVWLIEQLEAHLKRDLDPSIKLGIDETQLPYLRDDRLEEAKALAALGCFTANEVRAVMGYTPVAGGDELTKPTAPAAPADQPTDTPPGNAPKEVSHNADTSRRSSEKSRLSNK